MNYVAVAYVLTATVIGGYAVSVVARRREVERSLLAWREQRGISEEDGRPQSENDLSAEDEAASR